MVFTSTLSKIKLRKWAGEGLGPQLRPSQHKREKTRERVRGTPISKEVGKVSHRTGFSLTLDRAARTQPPSFIKPLATSSEVPRSAVSASPGLLSQIQNLGGYTDLLICIFTRSPGDSCVHYSLRSTELGDKTSSSVPARWRNWLECEL